MINDRLSTHRYNWIVWQDRLACQMGELRSKIGKKHRYKFGCVMKIVKGICVDYISDMLKIELGMLPTNRGEFRMIEQLTAEQEAQLAVYRDRGLEIGLKCGKIDEEKADTYSEKLMKFLDRKFVGTVIADGPIEAQKLVHVAQDYKAKQVPGETKAERRARLKADLMADIVRRKGEKITPVWPYLTGQYFSYYAVWVQYMREVLKLDGLPETWVLEDQCEFGGVYPLEDLVIVCQRPNCIHMADGGLHNESGPSLQYADGTTVWSINGHRVTEQIVMHPETLTIQQITEEQNQEVKRIMLDRFGYDKYLTDIRAEVVDTDVSKFNGARSLMKADDIMILCVACPTGRVYYLEVDPNCNTCEEADAWLGGDIKARQIGRT